MPTLTITLPRPHPAQARIIREARRFNVVCCGRRFGKSVLGIDRLIQPALNAKPVAYLTPTYKMLTEVWRETARVVAPLVARTDVQQHRLELITGGVVDMWSLDSANTARGRKYARLVVDEAAMVPALRDAFEEALRPTLVDLQGDAWFLSTPKGLNYFHTIYQRGQDPEQREWASWQMPTAANPFVPSPEIAAMAADMTEQAYAQEILAQFVADGTGVFRGVLPACTAPPQRETEYGHQYVIGADWGRSHDYTVFSVLDATDRRQVWLDRSNRVEYAQQRGRLGALCERYHPVAVVAEANAMGEPIIEQLRRDGVPVQPFTTTNASKAAVIDGLALAFERADLAILDDPTQTAELLAYTSERLPSGLIRYSAPPGQHDDTVIALALSLWGASATQVAPLDADLADRLINYVGY